MVRTLRTAFSGRRAKAPSTDRKRGRSTALGAAERQLILLLVDVGIICLLLRAIVTSTPFVGLSVSDWLPMPPWVWYVTLAVVWSGVALLVGCYEPRTALRAAVGARRVAFAALLASVAYMFVPRISAPLTLTRGFMLTFVAGMILSLVVWRLICVMVLSRPMFRRRVVVIGTGDAAQELGTVLDSDLGTDFDLVGCLTVEGEPHGQSVIKPAALAGTAPSGEHTPGFGVVGDASTLLRVCDARDVDELILATTEVLPDDLERALIAAYEAGIEVTPMAPVYEALTGRVPVEHVGSYWMVSLPRPAPRLTYAVIKRLTDVVLAAIGLIVMAAVFPFVALAIYVDSPGPVFFWQDRIGRHGKPFSLVKFRSWTADDHGTGRATRGRYTRRGVTSVGQFMRRTRLDELPQFWNVLKGEMSLIGPRPFVPEEVEALDRQIPFFRARLLVRPGLTGWAQVNHGYSNAMADAGVKLQYDLYYLKHQSIYLDLIIVLKTIGVMLLFKGT
jgi:exopolysaccharide biosynthesis polyprenyl glycosylphosphotransferase